MKKVIFMVLIIFTFLSTNVSAESFFQTRDTQLDSLSTFKLFKNSNLYATTSYVDYSNQIGKPQSQGSKGSCVAFSAAYLKTYYESKNYGTPNNIIFSQDFLYNVANFNTQQSGMSFEQLATILKEYGMCEYNLMPYDINGDSYPSEKALINAEYYKQDGLCAIINNDEDVNECKDFLAQGNVFIAGITAYSDILTLNKDNYIYNATGSFAGYHAVCIIGYDDSIRAFKAINSWGTNWGKDGYFYIPYNFFITDKTSVYLSYDSSNYNSKNIECYINHIKLISDMPGMIINSRAYFPIRAIAESLNCNISWNNNTKEICLVNSNEKFIFHNQSLICKYYYNNIYQQDITLLAPVTIVNGRTLLPIRDIGNLLKKKVNWIQYARIVDIR